MYSQVKTGEFSPGQDVTGGARGWGRPTKCFGASGGSAFSTRKNNTTRRPAASPLVSRSAASRPPFQTPDSLLSCFSKCNEWERVEQRGRPWDELQGQVSLPPKIICFPDPHIPLREMATPGGLRTTPTLPPGGEEGRPLLWLPEVDSALQSIELGAQAPQSSCPGLGEARRGEEKQRGTWAGKYGHLSRKGREGGWCFATGSCLHRPSQGRVGSKDREGASPHPCSSVATSRSPCPPLEEARGLQRLDDTPPARCWAPSKCYLFTSLGVRNWV